MTRPILRPILNAVGAIIRHEIIGFDYKADHAYRGTTRRYRRCTAGTSPRRMFRTIALRP